MSVRQCRAFYELVCEKIEAIDEEQASLTSSDIDKHLSLEILGTDLEYVREALYFQGGLGEEPEDS